MMFRPSPCMALHTGPNVISTPLEVTRSPPPLTPGLSFTRALPAHLAAHLSSLWAPARLPFQVPNLQSIALEIQDDRLEYKVTLTTASQRSD